MTTGRSSYYAKSIVLSSSYICYINNHIENLLFKINWLKVLFLSLAYTLLIHNLDHWKTKGQREPPPELALLTHYLCLVLSIPFFRDRLQASTVQYFHHISLCSKFGIQIILCVFFSRNHISLKKFQSIQTYNMQF